MITGFLVALTAAMVSTPISVGVYGGITASGSSFITAYLLQTGQKLLQAVLITNFLVEPFDKVSTAILAFAIVQGLSTRFLARFPRPENVQVQEGITRVQTLHCCRCCHCRASLLQPVMLADTIRFRPRFRGLYKRGQIYKLWPLLSTGLLRLSFIIPECTNAFPSM